MALRDWVSGVATVATVATLRPVSPSTVARVATVARGRDSADAPKQPTNNAELRRLVAIVSADWPADEKADALAAALADADNALTCFRALVAERQAAAPARAAPAPDMTTCRSCANLSPGGRCLAAWRGESLGDGIGTSRRWSPQYPDDPLRCGAYAPGPDDPDKRTGLERWPFLFNGGSK